jgi:hypothetical protein
MTEKSSSTQNQSGRAFEFAVLTCVLDVAKDHDADVQLHETKALAQAKAAFDAATVDIKAELLDAAKAGVRSLSLLEPLMFGVLGPARVHLAEDRAGQQGDVRDIIISRPLQAWEIGLSAKHNHKALKSPRLSNAASFGKAWLDIDCSDEYREAACEIFAPIREIAGKQTWREFGEENKLRMYTGILEAFKQELLYQSHTHGAIVAENLLRFLLGNKDFYKLMRIGQTTQLQPFNIYGTLGKGTPQRRPVTAVRKLPLPTEFLKIAIVSDTTMHIYCDRGWQISLRVHNKDSVVQPSLAFDVNLIGQPSELFTLLMPFGSADS